MNQLDLGCYCFWIVTGKLVLSYNKCKNIFYTNIWCFCRASIWMDGWMDSGWTDEWIFGHHRFLIKAEGHPEVFLKKLPSFLGLSCEPALEKINRIESETVWFLPHLHSRWNQAEKVTEDWRKMDLYKKKHCNIKLCRSSDKQPV